MLAYRWLYPRQLIKVYLFLRSCCSSRNKSNSEGSSIGENRLNSEQPTTLINHPTWAHIDTRNITSPYRSIRCFDNNLRSLQSASDQIYLVPLGSRRGALFQDRCSQTNALCKLAFIFSWDSSILQETVSSCSWITGCRRTPAADSLMDPL